MNKAIDRIIFELERLRDSYESTADDLARRKEFGAAAKEWAKRRGVIQSIRIVRTFGKENSDGS